MLSVQATQAQTGWWRSLWGGSKKEQPPANPPAQTTPAPAPSADKVDPPKPAPDKPVIGLLVEEAPAAGKAEPKGAYASAVRKFGGEVRFLCDDGRPLAQQLEGVHALLIPGGRDIHPDVYGRKPERWMSELPGSKAFDLYEKKITQEALQLHMPIRGICRGLQMLNVAAGGDLIQDIPSMLTRPYPSVHHRVGNHDIVVLEQSRLSKMVGKQPSVNTYHHQAVATLAKGFVPIAMAADEIIEGIEKADDPTVLAVQFHPERDDRIKKAFFESLVKDADAFWKHSQVALQVVGVDAEKALSTLQESAKTLRKDPPPTVTSSSSSYTYSSEKEEPLAPAADELSGRLRENLLAAVTQSKCESFYKRDVVKALRGCSRFTEPQAELLRVLIGSLNGKNGWGGKELLVSVAAKPDLSANHCEMLLAYSSHLSGDNSYSASQAMKTLLNASALTDAQMRLAGTLAPSLGASFSSDALSAVLGKADITAQQEKIVGLLLERFNTNGIYKNDIIKAALRQNDLTEGHLKVVESYLPSMDGSNVYGAAQSVVAVLEHKGVSEEQAARVIELKSMLLRNDSYRMKDEVTKILKS